LGYAAINLGVHDLALGLSDLRRLQKAHKVAFVSSSLRDAKTGQPAFARTVVTQVGPLKVGVFGLMSDAPQELGKHVLDQGLEVLRPVDAAREAVKELQGQGVDCVIGLAQLRRPELERVLSEVKGIALMLGSTDMELTSQLTRVGDGWWADAFQKGKYFGEVRIDVRGSKSVFHVAKLKDSLTQERAMLAQQVMGLQAQLDGADKPDSPLKLNDETRRAMEQQLASTRARLQRVTLQLEDTTATPQDATTMDLTMAALGSDIGDDPQVDGWVKKFQQKFPKVGSSH
jgi:2',3'-cyclic-nucleotide 2'-phosphodiesterase (5'-nucleotidase family)